MSASHKHSMSLASHKHSTSLSVPSTPTAARPHSHSLSTSALSAASSSNTAFSVHDFNPSYYDLLTDKARFSDDSFAHSTRKAPLAVDADYPLPQLPQARQRRRMPRKARRGFWGRFSTRQKIAAIAATVVVLAILAIGIGVGVGVRNRRYVSPIPPQWRPAIGLPWNIQLNSSLTNLNGPARVYDIDLFAADKETIDALHKLNKKAICYFSAGTYEDWRPDASQFPASDIGGNLTGWAGEAWLDTRSTAVRNVMLARLDQARAKGCDGVDPDNVDGYSHANNGHGLTNTTAVDYLSFLAGAAHQRHLAIGLKNAGDIVPAVVGKMDWAVVESCAEYDECALWHPFIAAGRPVFNIGYVDGPNATALQWHCRDPGSVGYSTILKHRALDEWYLACPSGTMGMR